MSLPADCPSPPRVELESFAGPLDLLLDEVRRQNIAIEKIAMAPIVSRFLEYMESAARHSLNLDIDWLHMAATLIHWKSLSLLGSGTEDPEADPVRDSLVRQLVVYRKEAAEELARRRAGEEARLSPFRGEPRHDEQEAEDVEGTLTVWDLIQQSRELARWVEEERQARLRWQEIAVERDSVTVDEMIGYLEVRLASDGELNGLRLLEQQSSPSRRAALFLGMLQMASDQQLQLDQPESFGPIQVRRRSQGR